MGSIANWFRSAGFCVIAAAAACGSAPKPVAAEAPAAPLLAIGAPLHPQASPTAEPAPPATPVAVATLPAATPVSAPSAGASDATPSAVGTETLAGAHVLGRLDHEIFQIATHGSQLFLHHATGNDSFKETGVAVSTVPSDGGTLRRISRDDVFESIGRLFPTDAGLFYTVGEGFAVGRDAVWKMPLPGGAPTHVATCAGCALATNRTHLFWTSNDHSESTTGAQLPAKIMRTPLAGGAVETLSVLSTQTGLFHSFQVVDDQLYYTGVGSNDDDRKAVFSLSANGGTPRKVLVLPKRTFIKNLVVRGKELYVQTVMGELFAYPIAGGTARVVVGPNASCGARMWIPFELSTTHVYWADEGKLQRCALHGGKPELLFTSKAPIPSLKVTDGGVLFAAASETTPGQHLLLKLDLH